jgi:hypothetical protein
VVANFAVGRLNQMLCAGSVTVWSAYRSRIGVELDNILRFTGVYRK